ncbi:unnamed protein product, partial [Cyprideis torosa]
MEKKNYKIQEALTFDDVLLVPNYSEVLPRDVDLSTRITRDLKINIPIVSAAMDTVTEYRLAIAIARSGGIERPIKELMTTQNLVTAPQGTTLKEAQQILQKHKIEKLPVIDADNALVGLITYKDIMKVKNFPDAAKDAHGRLLVGAAVGVTSDTLERVSALVDVDVDVITVDTAHGHSLGVLKAVE